MNLSDVYQIGDLRISKITEQVFSALSVAQLYPDATPHLLEATSSREQMRQDTPVEMSIHSWLVETPQHRLLIDTASGNFKDRPFSSIFHQLQSPWLGNLERAGVRPEDIDFVLHTHLHVDHVGWNTVWDGEKWVPTFANAMHVCSQAELDFYGTPAAAPRLMIFEDSIKPVRDAGQLATINNGGEEYLPGIKFHPTPGHSPGHMSISIESGDGLVVFCGDVMHSPLQVALPQWNSVFCAEQVAARVSRRWLLEYADVNCATVFTSHFTKCSVGHITKANGQYAWAFI
ncbi:MULTISPECIES: MBL fold metallo-hydrolase [unclassified Pseudomonas]|jgi:glyoxylase-like metal-dependent hydrolase (beta-lactamase superfamily II)|uniref:MBL fold metallo-hydrolase n=1 Tax=unclassified Pseudomonas TaxID=196821 RepID=UPI003CF5C3EB